MPRKKSETRPPPPRPEGEANASASNRIKILLTIITVVGGLIGTLVVGYWQFGQKPNADSPKTVSFTGRVTDAVSGKPISKAKISVEEDQEVPQIKFTDSEGVFHLTLRDTTKSGRIRVESDGYQAFDRNISLSRTGIEEIPLQPIAPPLSATPSATPEITSPNRQSKKVTANPSAAVQSNASKQSNKNKAYNDLDYRGP